jgi:hypothetical protein
MTEHSPDARFLLVAEILRQAMYDAADGIMCGLLDERLSTLRKPVLRRGKGYNTNSAQPNEFHMRDAARFLTSEDAQHCCDILATHAPRSAPSIDYIRKRVRAIARGEDTRSNPQFKRLAA